MPHILIVGAGISGLAAAYRITQLMPEADVTVVEKNSRIGGNILTDTVWHAGNHFLIEGAADSFLSRKPRGIAICEELGLLDQIQGRDPRFEKTYVKFNGELHPLPAGLTGMIPTNLQAMNNSELLSEAGRARLAQEVDQPVKQGDEDESLASFVSRRLGQEAYERMVEPLMSGIYAGDGTKLSLAATFPQLRQLEKKHGSLIRGLTAPPSTPVQPSTYPPFVALRGGSGELLNRLATRIGSHRIRLSTSVQSLRRYGNGFQVLLSDGSTAQFEGVVLAVPAFAIAELVEEMDAELALLHAGIDYSSAATITLGYRDDRIERKFTGYGYVIPQIENNHVLACSWMSNKWQGRAPADYHLARVYIGRFGNSIIQEASDEQLTRLAEEEMRQTLGIACKPEFIRIYRWHQSMPQYTLGHVGRIEKIEAIVANIEGLAVAGAAYHGVGIPDCIASGESAAEQICSFAQG